MAKFTTEEAVAVMSIQQLVNDWATQLDVENGLQISDLVTEDCVYIVGGTPRNGRPEVAKFYSDRFTRLSAEPSGVPVQRHIISNLRVQFQSGDSASISFSLVYFTTAGMASGLDHADPAAVADVQMNVRRDGDGHWRISRFDSGQTFRRVAKP